MRFSRLTLLFKIAITTLLLGLILWKVDWSEVARALPRVRISLILLVFVCMLANVLVSSYKWKVLLAVHGVASPFAPLARYYFAAFFFNNFFPTSIGGDGYRVFKTARSSGSRSRALAAVLSERVAGLIALLVVGVAGGLSTYLRSGDDVAKFAVVVGALGLVGFAGAVPLLRRDSPIGGWIGRRKSISKLLVLFDRIGDYRNHPGRTLGVAAISIAYHLFLLTYRFVLVLAVGQYCPPDALAVVVAASTALALLPISLNGYGLMDGSYVFLLRHYGVAFDEAVLIMVLIRLLHLPLSLLGGIFYLADPQRREVVPDGASHTESSATAERPAPDFRRP